MLYLRYALYHYVASAWHVVIHVGHTEAQKLHRTTAPGTLFFNITVTCCNLYSPSPLYTPGSTHRCCCKEHSFTSEPATMNWHAHSPLSQLLWTDTLVDLQRILQCIHTTLLYCTEGLHCSIHNKWEKSVSNAPIPCVECMWRVMRLECQ